MCVACPARVIWVGTATEVSRPARAVVDGIERDVDLVMVPDAGPGDHVILHSGYALRIVDQSVAEATIALLAEDHA